MKQIIDIEKMKQVAMDHNYEYIFHWKERGEYKSGTLNDYLDAVSKLYSGAISEVVGFMKDPELTEDQENWLLKETMNKIDVLFETYSRIDFCLLTDIINQNYTDGFNDNCIYVKCSDYIDITKHEYDVIDIQTIVKAFANEALKRYLENYKEWMMDGGSDANWEPRGEFCHNNIVITIERDGVDISYRPVSVYVSSDYSKED